MRRLLVHPLFVLMLDLRQPWLGLVCAPVAHPQVKIRLPAIFS
jgi:hypothetical protein